MAVLGRQAILQAIDDGLIAIMPFNADHVGPASVDLTLGSTFRVFRHMSLHMPRHIPLDSPVI